MADVFAYLDGFGASGGEGGTLKVNAPPLVVVTITNKAGKTKTKTANADGMAIFKGLASGKWDVTIVNNDGKPTTITADVQTEYTVTIAFFSATINITYPAGSTCTCVNGETTITAPDTNGTWVCTVPNAGTWVVAATDGTESTSADVIITTDGQSETIELSYQVWLYKAGKEFGGWAYVPMKINASYPNATEPTVNKDSTSMKITQPTYVNGCAYVYNNEVDLTTLDTLSFDGELSTAMTAFADAACLCIWTSLGTYVADNRVAYINYSTKDPKKIDITSLTGKHRVGFFLFSNGTYAKVNSLLLE